MNQGERFVRILRPPVLRKTVVRTIYIVLVLIFLGLIAALVNKKKSSAKNGSDSTSAEEARSANVSNEFFSTLESTSLELTPEVTGLPLETSTALLPNTKLPSFHDIANFECNVMPHLKNTTWADDEKLNINENDTSNPLQWYDQTPIANAKVSQPTRIKLKRQSNESEATVPVQNTNFIVKPSISMQECCRVKHTGEIQCPITVNWIDAVSRTDVNKLTEGYVYVLKDRRPLGNLMYELSDEGYYRDNSVVSCLTRALRKYQEPLWDSQSLPPKSPTTFTQKCSGYSMTIELNSRPRDLDCNLDWSLLRQIERAAWKSGALQRRGRTAVSTPRMLGPTGHQVGSKACGSRYRQGSDCGHPSARIPGLATGRSLPRYSMEEHEPKFLQPCKPPCQNSSRPSVPKIHFDFDSLRIGKTEWVLHTVVHRIALGSTQGLGVSTQKQLIRGLLKHQEAHRNISHAWVPCPRDGFVPIVSDDLYLVKIIAAQPLDDDRAIAYFLASPVANVSLRLFYRVLVVYDDATARTAECLTCPLDDESNGFESSEPGTSPQCLWAEVNMGRDALRYILKCWGPEVPWLAIVSTHENLVLQRLALADKLSSDFRSLPRPLYREFEMDLGNGFQARARLHLPANWSEGHCPEGTRLLLRLGDRQCSQLVNARFDLSITNYLVLAEGYAVLYADVRGSEFQRLDLASTKFWVREVLQVEDYLRVVAQAGRVSGCPAATFGAFGEEYGGHMALKLLAADRPRVKREEAPACVQASAVRPSAPWQQYVPPYASEDSSGDEASLRRSRYRSQNLAPMVTDLADKDLTLYTGSPKHGQPHYYTDNLLGLLRQQNVSFGHEHYDDPSADLCPTKTRLYGDMVRNLKRSFDGP